MNLYFETKICHIEFTSILTNFSAPRQFGCNSRVSIGAEANIFRWCEKIGKYRSRYYPRLVVSTSHKIGRLKLGKALQKRRLANPVVSQQHGPLHQMPFFVGEIESLFRAKATDVFDRQGREIDGVYGLIAFGATAMTR